MESNEKIAEQKIRILIEELRSKAKEKHFIRANLWNENLNRTEEGLRNLLFVLVTFIFTFSSPLFVNFRALTETDKMLLFLSWLFLLISLICGFIQTFIDIKYLFLGAERESEGEHLWSHAFMSVDKYEETLEEDQKLYKNFSPHSNIIAFILQILFLVLAFLLMLSVASMILFRM